MRKTVNDNKRQLLAAMNAVKSYLEMLEKNQTSSKTPQLASKAIRTLSEAFWKNFPSKPCTKCIWFTAH
ncbi:hypothetical protein DdX_00279 [Ditylenchus destructor]|uniref:Uncharacterized protein n=1 Tax=Ditylenchus destructor TaxID=166010 RepID=A0AAD4NKA1_9BILA|nr:hypothetical protein DdX_00279 [Ditylenchus destructor]